MIIKLSDREMKAVEAVIRNFEGSLVSNHLMKVVKNKGEDGKKDSYELKIRKAYTEPVLEVIAKYSGFIVPMVKSGITMLKSMSGDIDAIEEAIVKADEAQKAEEAQKQMEEATAVNAIEKQYAKNVSHEEQATAEVKIDIKTE